MSLEGKVVVITGGVLGECTAGLLAKEGAIIAMSYNSKPPKRDFGKNFKSYQADLTAEAGSKSLFESVKKDFGKIDIAINNAGKVLKKPMTEITEREYDDMFAVNSKAAFFFIKHAALNVSDNGKIITTVTALLAAFTGYYSVYAGAKAPVEHFTRAAAKELQPRGISVNAIAPGPMDTPFFYGQETDEAVAFHKSQGLHGRLTKVEDIAPIMLHLCSSGQWITGQTIFANGGYTTR